LLRSFRHLNSPQQSSLKQFSLLNGTRVRIDVRQYGDTFGTVKPFSSHL